jgi:pilus assembly protein CpaB
MDRGTRTLVVVAVAVATATVASASVYRAIKRIPVREVQVAHQFIVLATRPVPLGSRVNAADVKLVAWPSDSPLPGAFSRIEEVVGRGVIDGLSENEPVSESKLAPRDAGAGLSPAIPAGMRAISVKVNEVIGVAGFAVPGARVDVVATVRRPDDAVSRVLIANVQVLTAGTRYEQEKPRDAKPIPSTVVTLVVSPAQAEKIALASAEGQLTLMLRNPLDIAEPVTTGARLARLVEDEVPRPVATAGAVKPPVRTIVKAEIAAPAAPDDHAYTFEAIRAGKRTTEAILK